LSVVALSAPSYASIMDRVERKALRDEASRLFAENLKRLREERGMQPVDLGKKAGLNRTHVGYLESGKRAPALTTIKVLTEALEVGSDELLDDPAKTRRPRARPQKKRT
jgi:transcriptional regulator with XRE-family HTH domain